MGEIDLTGENQRRAIVQGFLDCALERAHPEVLTWLPETDVERSLLEEVQDDVEWLYNEDWTHKFASNCPVEGATADDYKGRIIDTPDGLKVLAGIRFQGLDLDRPFVEIMQQSNTITTAAQLDNLLQIVRELFAPFRPKRMRIYQPSHLSFELGESSPVVVLADQKHLAAPLAWIKQLSMPEYHVRVSLTETLSSDFYAGYEEAYRQLHEERPWLEGIVEPETKDDFESYRAEGPVFEISVDGSWAGVVAAFLSSDKGLSGYFVWEIILKREFRGRGLGTVVQRKLAGRLEKASGGLLFGTIDAANTPSLRTAQRSSRRDVGGYYWISGTGSPEDFGS